MKCPFKPVVTTITLPCESVRDIAGGNKISRTELGDCIKNECMAYKNTQCSLCDKKETI